MSVNDNSGRPGSLLMRDSRKRLSELNSLFHSFLKSLVHVEELRIGVFGAAQPHRAPFIISKSQVPGRDWICVILKPQHEKVRWRILQVLVWVSALRFPFLYVAKERLNLRCSLV